MRNVRLIVLALFVSQVYLTEACSMFKVTAKGKTVVGTNEDNWRLTPHVWFEVGENGTYGCGFTGSRVIGANRYAAQSGMNEHGLTFSRLASYHPIQAHEKGKSLKLIENPDQFLMDLMHTCKNIEEVYELFDQYDRTCYLEDVFIYIEPSGDYLIVEPYKLIRGSDPAYVLSNFCPSITSESDRRKLARYRDGSDRLDKEIGTSWEFCTEISREMHVCRDKVGDGTLTTAIWNTADLTFKLYFYHDFNTGIVFDLKKELSKGNHQLALNELFPENEEFVQLANYMTPFNTPWLRVTLAAIGGFFLISSFIFMIGIFTAKSKNRNMSSHALLFLLLFLSFCYMFVLTTTIGVYYFPAPYIDPHSSTITVGSYFPYAIILLILLLAYLAWKKSIFSNWNKLSKSLLSLNALALLGVIWGFFYWGLLF